MVDVARLLELKELPLRAPVFTVLLIFINTSSQVGGYFEIVKYFGGKYIEKQNLNEDQMKHISLLHVISLAALIIVYVKYRLVLLIKLFHLQRIQPLSLFIR